jgi:hypothetical protein
MKGRGPIEGRPFPITAMIYMSGMNGGKMNGFPAMDLLRKHQ